MISVTRAKITQLIFNQKEDGTVEVNGTYQLYTDKGDVIAKTSFNGYEAMKIEFGANFCQDTIDNAELMIETRLGIQKEPKNG